MAAKLPAYDKAPWYKQFWLWFLIALPASVVIAGFTTLYIANIHSDDLVVDDYYKNGLAINRVLEKNAKAQALGIEAKLRFSEVAQIWQVEVEITRTEPDSTLSLSLSHPLEADQDFSVPLRHSESDVYRAYLPRPVAAHWHWIIESKGSTPWRLDGSIENGDVDNEPIL
jgi:hypothetical protein